MCSVTGTVISAPHGLMYLIITYKNDLLSRKMNYTKLVKKIRVDPYQNLKIPW